MRFHDLRHAYATWLVTDGVPINLVQRVMGHKQASTTLNRGTRTPDDYAEKGRPPPGGAWSALSTSVSGCPPLWSALAGRAVRGRWCRSRITAFADFLLTGAALGYLAPTALSASG